MDGVAAFTRTCLLNPGAHGCGVWLVGRDCSKLLAASVVGGNRDINEKGRDC